METILNKKDSEEIHERKDTENRLFETGRFIKRLRKIACLTEEDAEFYCLIVRSTYRRIENGENVQLSSFAQVLVTGMGMLDEHLVYFIIRKFAEFCWECRRHSRQRLEGEDLKLPLKPKQHGKRQTK